MDIRSLTCFCLAYECGSIGKAAKRAYLTRQGLSGVLKSVEVELGQPMFVRGAQGLEPTQAAHLVYPRVVELLDAYRTITRLCERDEPACETVGLAVAYGALLSVAIDELIDEFSAAYPAIAIDVDIVEPVFAAQCVADGSKDFALVAGPFESKNAEGASLCQVPLCAAVREDLLPLAWPEMGVLALKGLAWLGLSETFPLDIALGEFSRERGLDLDMRYEWHDYHLILDQMRQGRGACIVPANCADRFRAEGITVLALEDSRLTWDLCALTPRSRALSCAARTALDWFGSRFS